MPEHDRAMQALDFGGGWVRLAGLADGIEQKILAGHLDGKRRIGHRARLVRFAPQTSTPDPLVLDYWEEVFLVSGDLTGETGEAFSAGVYACRPPGTPHGPLRSSTGYVMLEVHSYDRRQ